MQMSNFGNRGFGGPPQPQRQGGRRGNRGGIGGFRGNSRFDQVQPRSPTPNAQQGGQRPNSEPAKPAQPQPQQTPKPAQPAQTMPPQAKPVAQTPPQKPAQTPQKTTPVPQKTDTPQGTQQQAKPQQPQQQAKPGQTPVKPGQMPAKPGQMPSKPGQGQIGQGQIGQGQMPAKPGQGQMGQGQIGQGQMPAKPGQGQMGQGQIPAKPISQDNVDKAAPEKQNAPNQNDQRNVQNQQKTQPQKTNFNGSGYMGKGGWMPVSKQGGQGNFNQQGQGMEIDKQGDDFNQGHQNQPGGNFNQGQGNFNKPGGNFNQGQGNKSGGNFNQGQGNKSNFNQGQGNMNRQGSFNQGQGHQMNKQGGNYNDEQGQGNEMQKQGGHFNQGQGNKSFGQKQWQGGPRHFGGGQGGHGQGGHGQGGHGPGGPRGQMRGRGPPPEDQMLAMKLMDLVGPLIDLPPIDNTEVKFNGRSRLYIGNLTSDVTEEEIMTMFSEYGEAAELFLNKEKNFGFIKMDYRVNAERAKRELDGKMRNGRNIRVRFAPHNAAVRVKNLPPFVTNELLWRAFEIFGKIERAYVRVDERGKSLGEGVVEYVRKPSALAALRNCTEKCFFLTSSLRPVIVESFEEPDELDGFPEKNLPKKHPDFYKAREVGPRFSEPNSFEHEYGTRWKQLHELHRQKEEALKKELAAEEEKLEAQMEYAKYEHETELLREQLRQREQDRERQKRSWEMAERAADERREAERAALLRQEEELAKRMRTQDDELRRRQQENTLFVQAQRLNTMLDRQETFVDTTKSSLPSVDGGFREQYDLGRGFDELQSRWEGPRQLDDFPSKRRRF